MVARVEAWSWNSCKRNHISIFWNKLVSGRMDGRVTSSSWTSSPSSDFRTFLVFNMVFAHVCFSRKRRCRLTARRTTVPTLPNRERNLLDCDCNVGHLTPHSLPSTNKYDSIIKAQKSLLTTFNNSSTSWAENTVPVIQMSVVLAFSIANTPWSMEKAVYDDFNEIYLYLLSHERSYSSLNGLLCISD